MQLIESILQWGIPLIITLAVFGGIIWTVQRTVPKGPNARIVKQLTVLVLGLLFMIAVVLAMPFELSLKGELLRLFGLVVTAVIALASTTFVSNAMSGLMLSAVRSFHTGDFIRVGEHFGRVTEKGLLHTEIQSEDRDLITLPNLFIITQPVKVVRTTGTLISADVSLGYDVHRARVSEALKAAALDAELEEPFVQITELGSYAVTYRVSGFLQDVANLVTKRTQLRGRMLDALHAGGIEIASPTIMNQRPLAPDQVLMPERDFHPPEEQAVETLMFDKADLIQRIEKFETQQRTLVKELGDLNEQDGDHVVAEMRWRERQIESIENILETLKTGVD